MDGTGVRDTGVLRALGNTHPFCPLHRLCGTYPPSYNLTFLSSQNVLLVTLITNTERRHPGFEATFFQLPKLSSKKGTAGQRRDGSEGLLEPTGPRPNPSAGELSRVGDRGWKLKPQGLLPLVWVRSPS